MTLFGKVFSYEGRLRRRDYWILSILLTLAVMCVQFAGYAALGGDMLATARNPWANRSVMTMLAVISLVMFWPTTAIMVKRGHDRKRPAAWAISLQVFNLLMVYGPAFNEALRPLATGVAMLVALYMLIDFGVLDGTKGPNRYGPSPKDVETPADVFA
jgi:uncharacterized membrane protein YhaH (DUF805 family)